MRGGQRTEDTYLLDRVRPVEAPSPVHVCLADLVTSLTAATFGLNTAVAGPTVAVLALLVEPVEVVLEIGDGRVLDGLAMFVEAGLEDVMCDIALRLPGDVHDVKAEHLWEGKQLAYIGVSLPP